MARTHIPFSWLADLDQRLRGSALEGRLNLDYLETSLSERGLFNLRYFTTAGDYISREQYFVLRHCSVLKESDKVGRFDSFYFPTSIHNNHLDPTTREIFVFRPDGASDNSSMKDFYAGISANDTHSALIPIFLGQELMGKLCVSWQGGEKELLPNDKEALRVLGSLIGQHARASEDAKLREAREEIDRIHLPLECDLEEQLQRFLSIVRALVPCYIASIFEYNWGDDQLVKIIELNSEMISPEKFEETYERGRYLTGEALDNSGCRLVLDLDRASAIGRVSVEPGSFQRHRKLIKRPLSVLYSQINTERRRYVVRLMAREERISTRFDNLDDRLLAYSTSHFCTAIDHYWRARSIAFISRLSQQAIKHFREIDRTRSVVRDEFKEIFKQQVIVIAASKNSDTADYVYGLNDHETDAASRITSANIIKFMDEFERGDIGIYSRASVNNKLGVKVFDAALKNTLVLVSISNEDVRGFLGFCSAREVEARKVLEGITTLDENLLSIISAVFSGAMLAGANHISTENAKRLIGQIGHEIEGPIVELSGTAHTGLMNVREIVGLEKHNLSEVKRRVNLTVETARVKMHLLQEHISILMDVAVAMAQETENRIDVTFASFDLSGVLRGLADKVRYEVGMYQTSGVKCQFDLKAGLSRLNAFVGDQYLIEKVFLNLFRNALKYSIPPGGGKPIVIMVEAIQQTEVLIIQVTNWGSRIPRREFERIFRPFERGEAQDRIRARRGMGLGLYIARRFAIAHEGNVICKLSEPTLDDPNRKFLEGYLTTFEVRLSRNLRQGPAEVRI
jgi:signal transduction histidine kinase